jgi:NADPH:quinone reductase-like Zn-dependent oxidoreductase
MQAITVRDRDAGVGGLSLTEVPYPHAAENDVIVRVHAAGFTPGELDWRATWADRAGRDRTPSVPGHELSGVVVELGYGTTGLTVGQRVFGLADWTSNGSLAEYTAVEARNLAPLPADIDHAVAAALPVSGLSAWQGLFDHAGLTTGQTVLIHGAAGGVGSIAVQLARDVGTRIIGTGRAPTGTQPSVSARMPSWTCKLTTWKRAGEVEVVFDVIGGDILDRSTALVRADGMLVTIAAPPKVRPEDGRAIFFVVEPDRARLADLAQRLRHGRLKPIVGAIWTLPEGPPRSPPTGAPPARRSSRSPEAEKESNHVQNAACQRHSGRRHSGHGRRGASCCRGFAATVQDADVPAPLGDNIAPVETATAESQGQDVHLGDRILPAQCTRSAAPARLGVRVRLRARGHRAQPARRRASAYLPSRPELGRATGRAPPAHGKYQPDKTGEAAGHLHLSHRGQAQDQ